jgi:hypothetical protein
MGILLEIVGGLLVACMRAVIEVPLIWLGEVVRWMVTLGRHQPRWDCYLEERGGAFVLLSEISLWIGLVTAAAIGLCIKSAFFGG